MKPVLQHHPFYQIKHDEKETFIDIFTRFGSWLPLVKAIARLKLFIRSFKSKKELKQLSIQPSKAREMKQEVEPMMLNPHIIKEAEIFIIQEIQRHFYSKEIDSLRRNQPINTKSNLI